ncbi:MAG: hypothetical protein MPW17_22475 (plasmid) [Candidatus Manganitrophus sp.]|nr:MAG: hypothetical protein MPW17_22475 [Candidatus Manganitrophus sp.]
MRDPTSSIWLKITLKTALERDCVQAYGDAMVLKNILKERMDHHLGHSR